MGRPRQLGKLSVNPSGLVIGVFRDIDCLAPLAYDDGVITREINMSVTGFEHFTGVGVDGKAQSSIASGYET